MLLASLLVLCGPSAFAVDVRSITDAVGRKISVPMDVQRVACLTGACYEKVFLLGEADKIVVRQRNFPPWMERTNPKAKTIPLITAANTEDLLSRGVQVAFAFDQAGPLAAMHAAGIPALVATSRPPAQGSREDFIRRSKEEVQLFGRVLGPHAAEVAAEWCAYFDARLAAIVARTDAIPPERRPKIYYVRGPDALTTHGRDSSMQWYGEIAGGDFSLARRTKPGISQVSIEEIVAWNPDVIFVGRQYATDLVTRDPRWSGVKAVKDGKVVAVPDGVFFWDSSSEGILLLEFLAKTLHPTLFASIDLVRDLKDYYARFYRYELSDDEARNLLAGLRPDGTRHNPTGN